MQGECPREPSPPPQRQQRAFARTLPAFKDRRLTGSAGRLQRLDLVGVGENLRHDAIGMAYFRRQAQGGGDDKGKCDLLHVNDYTIILVPGS